MFEILITMFIGLLAGGIVNLFADDLPFQRLPGLPTYPDGTPRPLAAWLGITAFLLGKRSPGTSAPDESRSRPYYNEDGEILFTPDQLSWRYPLAEILTIAFMLMTVKAAPNIVHMTLKQEALYLFYMAVFALVIVIDMEHKLILRVVIIPSVIVALLDALFLNQVGPSFQDAIFGALFGFGIFFLFYLGGYFFNIMMERIKGVELPTAFGYGDVMMITLSGSLLGLGNTFMSLFVTVFLGAGGALLYLLARRIFAGGYSAFSAIPYGPYIVIGTMVMLLYEHPVQCYFWGYALSGAPC